MNYGEELAYWYLRFNGFFPLTDYVFHRDIENSSASDCDLLAIRHPFTKEPIGGQHDDWDPELRSIFQNWDNNTLAIICEVKTGSTGNIFPINNIDRAVDRLGLFQNANSAKTRLANNKSHCESNFEISKLLIADQNNSRQNYTSFIPLSHALDFLEQRIGKYLEPKFADRHFFNSSLLQQLIWQVRKANR